jgi:hypothetical protein
MRIICSGLLFLLVVPVGIASAQQQPPPQQQTDSVAAAARRTREQKKEQVKPVKVWDNDTMPNAPGAISVVGESAGSNGDSSNQSTANASTPGSTPGRGAASGGEKPTKDAKALLASLAAAKDQLQSLKAELNILQRQYDLDAQMYYGKPNYVADRDGAAKLADEKSQLDAKQQEVDAAQKKVDQLEAEIKDSGPPSDSASSKTN